MRLSVRSSCLALTLVLTVTAGASSAHAQRAPSSPQEREARQLFQQGVEMTRFERWGEALEFFRRSRALVDRPSTTLNIGFSLLRMGRVLEAEPMFVSLLALPPGQLEPARRAEAEGYLQQARQARATLQLTVEPGAAHLEVDGAPREGTGASREVPLDPGSHRLRIFADEYRDETLEVSALPGTRLERSVRLTAVPVETRVVIEALQSQAEIRVDGVLLEQTNQRDVTPGEHLVEVTAPGYRPFRRSITVPRGQTVNVTAELSRPASVASSPFFWLGLGAGAAAIVGTGLLIAFAGPEVANGGSTQQVFYTITTPF